MIFKNTLQRYGSITKIFHWIIAVLIITMLFLGFLMEGQAIVNLHQLIGLTILSLAACRLIWTLLNPHPRLPSSVSRIEKIAARTVQALLYFCLFAMPLSGWFMSTAFGFIPHIAGVALPMPGVGISQDGHIFQYIHNTLALVLIALIGLHVAGALKHYFIDKDPSVLKSMLPGGNDE